MNIKQSLRLLILFFTLGITTLPMVALAHHCCWHCRGPALIYNESDDGFYVVPGGVPNTIYRSVDWSYYPVAKYGCHWGKHHHCYYHFVTVECQTMPGHWISTQWYPPSKVCFYK